MGSSFAAEPPAMLTTKTEDHCSARHCWSLAQGAVPRSVSATWVNHADGSLRGKPRDAPNTERCPNRSVRVFPGCPWSKQNGELQRRWLVNAKLGPTTLWGQRLHIKN